MFNPMQTQAALQNPAQFPDQRLQQYAAGQPPQPTGQVPPGPGGPAGLELTARNAQRQAAARASAMQNDPSQSPTIFQQKDAQMAQQAQMMQQKEAQIAKKEQALGLIGALMARSQPRMSGIAQLPMRPDMYTAMDGGIVFKAGGEIQNFQKGGTANLDVLLEEIAKLPKEEQQIIRSRDIFGLMEPDAYLLRRRLAERGYIVDPKTNRITNLPTLYKDLDGGQKLSETQRRALEYVAKTGAADPQTFSRMMGYRPSTPPPARASASTAAPTATAAPSSLTAEQEITRRLNLLAPYMTDPTGNQALYAKQRELAEAYGRAPMTDEQILAARTGVTDPMEKEYLEYTKGRSERQQKVADALRGKPYDIWSGIAAGLGNIPSTNNLRAYQVFAALGAGAGKAKEAASAREREAMLYLARAEDEAAKADLLERRGQRTAGESAVSTARKLALEDMERQLRAGMAGTAPDQAQALLQQQRQKEQLAIASSGLDAVEAIKKENRDAQRAVMLAQMKADRPKDISPIARLQLEFNIRKQYGPQLAELQEQIDRLGNNPKNKKQIDVLINQRNALLKEQNSFLSQVRGIPSSEEQSALLRNLK